MAWRRHMIQAKTREFYKTSSFSRLKNSSSSLGLTMTFWEVLSLQYSATSFVFKYTLHKKTFKKKKKKQKKNKFFFFPKKVWQCKCFGSVKHFGEWKDKDITGNTWTLSFFSGYMNSNQVLLCRVLLSRLRWWQIWANTWVSTERLSLKVVK